MGSELQIVFIVDVLKLPKIVLHRWHDVEPRSLEGLENPLESWITDNR